MAEPSPRRADHHHRREAILGPRHRGPAMRENAARQAYDVFDAARIAAMTRRGVIGVSFTSAPIEASASRTALAIAAGGAMAPPSPMPFTPYSVNAVGVSVWAILMAG